MRYVILLALLLCLPIRGEAWQVVGDGADNQDSPSFSFSMENDLPEIYTAPFYQNLGEFSTTQSVSGSRSWYSPTRAYGLYELNSSPNENNDYDFAEGTIEYYIRWSGTWDAWGHWQLKNEDIAGTIIYIQNKGSAVGQFNLYWAGTGTSIKASGMTSPDTWYKIRVKWRSDGTLPSLSVSVNDGTPVTGSATLTPITGLKTQIIIGNDHSTVGTFWIDDFKIWKKWLDD